MKTLLIIIISLLLSGYGLFLVDKSNKIEAEKTMRTDMKKLVSVMYEMYKYKQQAYREIIPKEIYAKPVKNDIGGVADNTFEDGTKIYLSAGNEAVISATKSAIGKCDRAGDGFEIKINNPFANKTIKYNSCIHDEINKSSVF